MGSNDTSSTTVNEPVYKMNGTGGTFGGGDRRKSNFGSSPRSKSEIVVSMTNKTSPLSLKKELKAMNNNKSSILLTPKSSTSSLLPIDSLPSLSKEEESSKNISPFENVTLSNPPLLSLPVATSPSWRSSLKIDTSIAGVRFFEGLFGDDNKNKVNRIEEEEDKNINQVVISDDGSFGRDSLNQSYGSYNSSSSSLKSLNESVDEDDEEDDIMDYDEFVEPSEEEVGMCGATVI